MTWLFLGVKLASWGRSYLVKPGFTEGQHATTTTVAALIVVIVNESQCRTGGHQTPTFAPVEQILERRGTMEHVAQLSSVCEFSHPTNLEVFAGLDRLRSLMNKLIKNQVHWNRLIVVTWFDNFLVDERPCSRRESGGSGQIVQTIADHFQVSRPHVFGSVETIFKVIFDFLFKYSWKNLKLTGIRQRRKRWVDWGNRQFYHERSRILIYS